MKSDSIKEIATALCKAQGQFDHAKKDVTNGFFHSKYADLASCIDAAKKPLSDNGLSVVQIVDTSEQNELILETILMHTSGEFISGKYLIRPTKNDPQGVGSAITYARRYAFSAITGIAADDDDGNAATGNATVEKKPQQVNYKSALEATKTPDQLAKVWASIPNADKPKFTEIKDAMKEKLAPQAEAA